jgi:hypothetical protein
MREAWTSPPGRPVQPAEPRRSSTLTTWLILGSSAVLYGVFIARTAFRVGGTVYFSLFDDAMISMRYAQNLAHGHGLVWNAGEPPVEGFTNPLWTLWMALLHLVGIPAPKVSLAVMVSGALLLLGTTAIIGAVTRRIATGAFAPALAMILTALFYPLVYWTLRGMEVGLLAFLFASAALLSLRIEETSSRRDLVLLGLVVFAAVATRVDAAVPCTAVAAYLFLRERRRAALAVVLSLVAALAAQAVVGIAYYGHVLPNTYYLKVHGIPLSIRAERGLVTLAAATLEQLWAPIILVVAYAWRRRRRLPPAALLLAGIWASTALYAVYVGGDAWEFLHHADRYITPSTPLLLALAAVGLDDLRRCDRRDARLLIVAGIAVFATCFALSVTRLLPVAWIQYGSADLRPQVVALALVVLWPVLVHGLRVRTSGVASAAVMTGGALLLLVGTNAFAWAKWGAKNAAYAATSDRAWTRYGLELRRTTAPDTSIAAAGVGAIAYFSDRPTVDLLGKSDRTIALTRPHGPHFHPGHDKWDYAYSIGHLRPDVIAQLWRPTASDLTRICGWGYLPIGQGAFVRRGDSKVEVRALETFVRAHELDSPARNVKRSCRSRDTF